MTNFSSASIFQKPFCLEIVSTSQVYGSTSPHVLFGQECRHLLDRRRPAGRAVRSAVSGKRHGKKHVWNRRLPVNEHRIGNRPFPPWPAFHDRLENRRSGHVCAGRARFLFPDPFSSGCATSFTSFTSVSQTEEMAVRAGSTGVYIVPAFVGLGAPSWDERARAVIVGLTFSTGTDELVRAALESMAFQVKDVLGCDGSRFGHSHSDSESGRRRCLPTISCCRSRRIFAAWKSTALKSMS